MTQRIKAKVTTVIEAKFDLALTEGQARALDALAGYGTKSFLDVFYKYLGRSYLQPYEKDLTDLFEMVRAELPPVLNRAERARRAALAEINGSSEARQS